MVRRPNGSGGACKPMVRPFVFWSVLELPPEHDDEDDNNDEPCSKTKQFEMFGVACLRRTHLLERPNFFHCPLSL